MKVMSPDERDRALIYLAEMKHTRELWDAEYLSTTQAVAIWAFYVLGVLAIIGFGIYQGIKCF